eukprot:gene29887-39057_t
MKLSIIKFFFFVIEVYLHVTLDAVSNPEEFVRPLAGSFTDGDKFSTGNTLPLIGRPWGFNHWSPQTKEANRDWGYFVFTPILTHWGQGVTRDPEHYWEPRGAVIKPYLFDATVAPYNLQVPVRIRRGWKSAFVSRRPNGNPPGPLSMGAG